MSLDGVRDFFVFRWAERDAGFDADVRRLARRGLTVVAFVEFGVTAMTMLAHRLIAGTHPEGVPVAANLYFIALGCTCLLIARAEVFSRYFRAIALTIGFLTSAGLSMMDVVLWTDHVIVHPILDLVIVLLVGVAVFPATFWHMLGLGVACLATYLGAVVWAAEHSGYPPVGPETVIPLVITVLLCAVLSGLSYQRILETYRAHQAALEERLRRSQSECAGSVLRLAATLSHEVNTPLGALKSAVDSITIAAERLVVRPDARLVEVHRQLASVVRESASRLEQTIVRLQRFTNLDRADVQRVDLEQLLRDVVTVNGHSVRMDIETLPMVTAQPQAISGALTALLFSLAQDNDALTLKARADDSAVRVRLEGARPISLEPAFEVRDGRIGASDWGLFNARELMRAQGGDVRVEDSAVVVEIPVRPATATARAAVA